MPFDYESLFMNPLFMAGAQGLLANPQDRGRAMLQGAQAGVQMQGATQQQQLRALQLQQAENAAKFNPMDYMQTTPQLGNAVQDQQIAQQPQQMPATLGGALGGQMLQQSPQAMANTPIPQPTPGSPTGHVDTMALLQAGMQAGKDPAEIAQLAAFMDPARAAQMQAAAKMAEPYTLSAGQERKVGDRTIGANTNPPPGDPAGVINRTMVAAQAARAAGNIPLAESLESKLQDLNGTFNHEMRQATMDNTQAYRESTLAARQEGLAIRRDSQALAQGQREQQNDFQLQRQATALGTQIAKAGIPQADQTLGEIEGLMQKYPKGDLPGYGPVQSLLPSAALSQDGQQLRQAVQGLANVQLKQRSGAAVTDQEFNRFKLELGSGALMSEDRIRQGIAHFRDLLESEKKNFAAGAPGDALQAYEESGGIPMSQYRHPRQKISIENATADDIAAAIARKQGKK